MQVQVLCFLIAWFSHVSAVGDLLVKPQAYVADQEIDDQVVVVLVENIGHVFMWKLIRAYGEEPWEFRPLQFCTAGDVVSAGIADNVMDKPPCHWLTLESFRESYDLIGGSYDRLAQGVPKSVAIYDVPRPLYLGDGQEAALPFLNASDAVALKHIGLAARAHARRYGQHLYLDCNEMCPPQACKNSFAVDVGWLLRPLWGTHPPQNVVVVNFGCRDFGPGDPIFSLLDQTALKGLFVDADGYEAQRARQRLLGHKVHTLHVFLTPQSTRSLLSEHVGAGPVDILKVDVDSFDISILDAALSVLQARVVMAEYNLAIPPPFRYAQQYADDVAGTSNSGPAAALRRGMFGASISYLVEFFALRGYLLLKMNHADTVWIHRSLAAQFSDDNAFLQFPVDEWACYLQARLPPNNDLSWWLPPEYRRDYTREWLLERDEHVALRRLWGNLSNWNRVPFTLDIAMGRVPGT